MIKRIAITSVTLLALGTADLVAQVNDKGTFHASVGIAAGGHVTTYETSLLGVVNSENDGAATVTYPIELGYGLGERFSLGLYIEPGVYLDSSASESNGLTLVGIQPRFYIVNGDRFAWMASLHLGVSALRYDVDEPGNRTEAKYSGANLGLSTGVGYYFSDHIGLNLQLRYVGTTMPLRSWSVNGVDFDPDLIDAKLTTRGVALQASLAFKF